MSGDYQEWPQADDEQQKPQAQWQQRKAPAPEDAPSLLFPADRVYEPYEARPRPEGLIFLTAILPAQGAAYHQLKHYLFDQHHGQAFTLFYSFMRVDVKGRLLAPVIHAVISYKCAILREWHRDLYDPPTRGSAVIESITITPMGEESGP